VDWQIVDSIGEFIGAVSSIFIACIALYIAARQWLDEKRTARERRELAEEMERRHEAAREEQDRIIRAQSLDSYFDGISTLLLRDGNLSGTARNLAKGRTDAILKVLKSDEKRDLVAFLYGSGLINLNGDDSLPVIGLAGSDLSWAKLNGFALRRACLSMVNLRMAWISESDLNEADLRGADLRGADLKGADLSRAIFHGAVLAATDLSGSDLSEADLSGADLREANFSRADLSEANLSGTNLRGADFSGANLGGANLSGANLREANLTGANLLGARLANLVSIGDADFTGVEGLSEEAKEYLCSIASGIHPGTGRSTRATLSCL
jgi:uncharacterized protein YjbI with pentapeptide repeats